VSEGVDVHVRGFFRHQADSPTRFPSLPPVRRGVSRGLENLAGTNFLYHYPITHTPHTRTPRTNNNNNRHHDHDYEPPNMIQFSAVFARPRGFGIIFNFILELEDTERLNGIKPKR
jgi:hypothetical protein